MIALLTISGIISLAFAGVFYYIKKEQLLPSAGNQLLVISLVMFSVLGLSSLGVAGKMFFYAVGKVEKNETAEIASLVKQLTEAKSFVAQLTAENEKLIKDREAANDVISSYVEETEARAKAMGVLKAKLAAVSDKQKRLEAAQKLEPVLASCSEPAVEFFTNSIIAITETVDAVNKGDE